MQRISSFDQLVFAEIFAASNHDVFAALPRLEQLKGLELLNIRAEIDCGVFRDLPNLLYNAKSPVPPEIRGELRKHIPTLSIGP